MPWAYAEPGSAYPAVYTSTGLRCTVVGTVGDDELSGTGGDDVVCGRGGNDVLRGGDGDDTLDGGPGADTVDGGAGTDELLGGDGADRLTGALGPDLLRGGPANDTLDGGDGHDRLFGEDHDDLLDGGPDADVVDGGSGDNRCPPSADDEQRNCLWDEAPPVAVSADVSPRTIDVTNADGYLTLRMHLTDDTGVSGVQVHGHNTEPDDDFGPLGPFFEQAELVSGTPRDGIWESRGIARRYIEPGEYDLYLTVHDVVGRASQTDFLDRVTVVSAQPDRQPPSTVWLTAQPESGTFPVHARDAPVPVVVEARITDDLSGVAQYEGWSGFSQPLVCLDYPQADGQYRQSGGCEPMKLVSGDLQDGVHRATVTVPQGASGGDWNLRISLNDRAGSAQPNGVSLLGPDLYQRWRDGGYTDPHHYPLPDGAGRVPVQGQDSGSPPEISEATVTPDRVDSRYDDSLVRVAVRAVDIDGDLSSVHGFLTSDGAQEDPSFTRVGTTQASGTAADGWWYVDFVVAKATPPGTYYLVVAVRDAAGNTTRYSSRSAPGAENHPGSFLPGPGTVTVTTS